MQLSLSAIICRLIAYIISLPIADTGFEFCVRNSTENASLKACDDRIVKVMLPPDSLLEYDSCLKDTVIWGGGGGVVGGGVGRGLHLHNVVLS